MTVQELIDALVTTFQKLDNAGVDDPGKRDLHILVLQLERGLEVAAFDPLKDLDGVTVVHTSQLKTLFQQVQEEIDNDKTRVQLVQGLVATAQVAFRAAGVPIPA